MPLAAAEVLSAPIPLIAHSPDAKDLQEAPCALCVQVEVQGVSVGTAGVEGTLKFYRCPGALIANKDNTAFRTKAIACGTTGVAQGAELVTNGDFAVSTGWTTEPGWSIAAGVAGHVGDFPVGSLYRTDVNPAAVGDELLLKYDIPTVPVPAAVRFSITLGEQLIRNYNPPHGGVGVGSKVESFKAAASGAQKFAFNAGIDFTTAPVFDNIFSLDNISLKKSPIFRDSDFVTVASNSGDAGPAVVVGFLPAASMAGTFLTMRIKRYGANY